jgi:hypothetical protein
MTIKQKVDKYLKDNYEDVVFETKIKGFRWQKIADKIGKDINKDVVKERWKVVKKKMEVENTKLTSEAIKRNEEIVWGVIGKDTLEEVITKRQKENNLFFNPPKETKSWNPITFLKNLFKNL